MPEPTLNSEFKSSYTDELKRKDELTKAVSVPIAVLTIIGSTLVYVLGTLSGFSKPVEIVQLALVVLTTIAMGVASHFLIRAYFGYGYEYVPTAQQLQDWKSALVEY